MSVQATHKQISRNSPIGVPPGWNLIGCYSGQESITEIPISKHSMILGRRSESDLCLPSPRVSGRHAELLFVGGVLFIRDLDSTNGTFINRQRVVQPTPIVSGDHIELADVEFRVLYLPPKVPDLPPVLLELKKTVQDLNSMQNDWILSQFHELMSSRSIHPHYQSILRLNDRRTVGYEALARCGLMGLESPAQLFRTAALVNQEAELSILCRERAIEIASVLNLQGPIFVNTHPHEDLQRDVMPSIQRLRNQFPQVAIIVEFHEKTMQSAAAMLEVNARLRDLGIQIAYDDFGAGQSRLLELMKAPPEYLKFDRGLIQDLHEAPPYQTRMLQSLVETAHEVGITTLAEGIETEAEALICQEIGFELGQGYYFSRPLAVPH